MTPQEIFNTVYKHLLTQNAKALNAHGECCYLAPDGKRCAVGCLIPPSEYRPEFENRSLEYIVGMNVQFFGGKKIETSVSLKTLIISNIRMLSALQEIHDKFPVEEWKELLAECANAFQLNVPEMN